MVSIIDTVAQDENTGTAMPFRTKSIEELMAERPKPDEINGVIVPLDVRAQLIDNGILPESLSQGELRYAVAACASGQLPVDPDATTWTDKLSPPSADIADSDPASDMASPTFDDDNDDDPPVIICHKHKGFRHMVIEQRVKKVAALASGVSVTTEITFNE